jgi:hypothetical protein
MDTAQAIIIFWALSNVVSTMPAPDLVKAAFKMGDGAALLYQWFYDIVHIAVGNAGRVFPKLRMLGNGLNPEKKDDSQ